MIGLTVVGKPVAQEMTSSPSLSALSPSTCDVSAVTASKLADDPEFVVSVLRVLVTFARADSNLVLNRPVVSQKSRQESTRKRISCAPSTLPLGGTAPIPATNGFAPCASSA